MCRRKPLVIGGGDGKICGRSPIPEQSMLGQERAEEMAQWLKAYTGPADDPS